MQRLFVTTFLAIGVFAAYAQSFTLRGIVVNESTEPIVGVKVLVRESKEVLTLTDSNGKFEISLPDTMKYGTIILWAAGYMTPEYHIDKNTNEIRIVMIKGTPSLKKNDIEVSKRVESDTYEIEVSGAEGVGKGGGKDHSKDAVESVTSEDIVIDVSYEIVEAVVTAERPIIEAGKVMYESRISVESVADEMLKDAPPTSAKGKKEVRKDVPSSSTQSNIKSGTLTSGEVNDFAKWHLWGNILKNDFRQYADTWKFEPLQRYIAQLTNKQGMPISNATVRLQNSKGDMLWQAKTDNTGKAELWIDFFKSETPTNKMGLKLLFEYEGKTAEISNVTPFEQGINTAQIDVACKKRNKVDMYFMIDATGSMSDEIRYLQVELDDIIQKIHKQQSELELRTGCLVYRDHGDQYLTRKSFLTDNVDKTLTFLREQSAGGGGDYPEAVDVALFESITNEDWDDEALARILFIVLDAPSHTQPEVLARLESQLRLAAEKGIRIVPIACSDIQKDGEYLMRTFALATNGTYLFLTDHSGVGNAHIKPTTDKYDVEKLNDAIVRVIKQYTQMPDCKNPKWAKENKNAEPSDKFIPNPYDEKPEGNIDKISVSDLIKVYPNPCSDILKIDIKKSDVQDIYLVDMTGKTLFNVHTPTQNMINFNVSTLSTSVYFVKVFYKGKWFSEKVIVKRL